VHYELGELEADMSFLEALDVLNERLMGRGDAPVAFDHD
jgi:succinate dehydrogenase / fumarate reductase iron-sulfur subunit